MRRKMKEVSLHLLVAQDGSGWSLSQEHDTRSAFVWKEPEETYLGTGHILIVPLTKAERQVFDKNVITKEGVTGLKVPNVKARYWE